MKYKSSSMRSKWVKTKWLVRNSHIKQYVPRTMMFNKDNLRSMLTNYRTVYFKPVNGSGGHHIVRIKKRSNGYQMQAKKLKTTCSTIDRLYNQLRQYAGKRSYLLQKGIHLAKTRGKPFDIRVMVQKTNDDQWVSTAIFMKIGKLGSVATNYNQGGSIGYSRQTLIGAGYNQAKARQTEERLRQLGVSVGRQFDRCRKGFRELGLDVAIDMNGRFWILEVNTRPQFYPLRYMKNKSLYQKIISYAKKYGRTG